MIHPKPHEQAAARIAQKAAAQSQAKDAMHSPAHDLPTQLAALKQAGDIEEQRLRIENLRQVNSDTYLNSIQLAYVTATQMLMNITQGGAAMQDITEGIGKEQLDKIGALHATLIDRLHAFWIREEQKPLDDNYGNSEMPASDEDESKKPDNHGDDGICYAAEDVKQNTDVTSDKDAY